MPRPSSLVAPTAGPAAMPTAVPLRRPPAPVRDRRPALAALAALLVVGGGLGSALVVHRSGDRVDVLVARHTIEAGQRITAEDFGVERVATDGAGVVPAAARENFVGTHATGRIPAGTLVNRTMFLAGGVVPGDAVVVGTVLGPTQRPAEQLQTGDVVRVYLVVKGDAASAVAGSPGQVLLEAARVVSASAATGAENASVSLLVPAAGSGDVVSAAAAGQIALAELAESTVPAIDFVRG
ncbi:SAF domain-containing protein [Kineococcus xinjiangensis]|uniref:SAF domain-containing protein n=1 Tax=Kineococcus xinjiangensis TaxID=512762 RepID=A0A2S6IWX0_9ACTN|nr:SAF domain-containing protein [Kineococcus xinjiangensis]PPK98785.1 SAF domain-containing protein [Kineococcus xinjiangensis]